MKKIISFFIAILSIIKNKFSQIYWDDAIETIGLYVLVAFVSIGAFFFLSLPFSRVFASFLIIVDLYIVIFLFCPIALYGIYKFVKEVVL
jgi:hypothetical protein